MTVLEHWLWLVLADGWGLQAAAVGRGVADIVQRMAACIPHTKHLVAGLAKDPCPTYERVSPVLLAVWQVRAATMMMIVIDNETEFTRGRFRFWRLVEYNNNVTGSTYTGIHSLLSSYGSTLLRFQGHVSLSLFGKYSKIGQHSRAWVEDSIRTKT